jgi:hypothetical protein
MGGTCNEPLLLPFSLYRLDLVVASARPTCPRQKGSVHKRHTFRFNFTRNINILHRLDARLIEPITSSFRLGSSAGRYPSWPRETPESNAHKIQISPPGLSGGFRSRGDPARYLHHRRYCVHVYEPAGQAVGRGRARAPGSRLTNRNKAACAGSGVRSPDGNGLPPAPDPRPHRTWPCGGTCRDPAHRHRVHRQHRAPARPNSRASKTSVRPSAADGGRMRAGVGQIRKPTT